jgi:hypothetical protein
MGLVDSSSGRGLSRLDANRASARDIECVLSVCLYVREMRTTREMMYD